MRIARSLPVLFEARLIPLFVTLIACNTPVVSPADAGTGDAYVAPTDAHVAHLADLAVTVTHEATGTLAREPLAGATVGIAQSGVLIADVVTGSDGIAHVDVDWSLGPVDVTAWAPGQRAHTLLALDERASATVSLQYLDYAEAGLGHLSGQLLNLDADAWVTTSIAPLVSQDYGRDTYALDLARGQSFVLFAFDMRPTMDDPRDLSWDINHFAVVEVPALTETDATLDIDFDVMQAETEVAHARIMLPGADGDTVYSQSAGSFAVRANLPTTGFLGLYSNCVLTAEADAFDCTMAFARVEHPTIDPITRYSLLMNGGVESGVHVRGYPVEGVTIDTVPELPTASVTTATGLTSTLAIAATTPGHERIRIFVNDLRGANWILDAPPGLTSATLPPLPAAIATAFETFSFPTAYVEACYERDEATDWCGRYSSSANVNLVP